MNLKEIMSNYPTLYVAIGPSGSGKSTYFKKLQQEKPNLQHYSWDALRHEFYDANDYANAFKLSTEDSKFNERVMSRFNDMLNAHEDIFVDNVNLTPKRRKVFLDLAHKKGYRTVGIVFNVPLETLIARQDTRGDKKVPEQAVRQQFASMVLPSANEFDQVIRA